MLKTISSNHNKIQTINIKAFDFETLFYHSNEIFALN